MLELGKRPSSPQDWLSRGWILEILNTSGSRFWIGGGRNELLALEKLDHVPSAVWTPSFFPNDDEGLAWQSAWNDEVSREELLRWIGCDVEPALSKVLWSQTPKRENFDRAFARLQRSFREEGVKKGVPVVFASGVATTNSRTQWFKDRLQAGLSSTSGSALRLYGAWSEEGGFLGATPEALFARNGSELSSMAVAGTRAASTLGTHQNDADAVAGLVREFLSDPKERREHELVVEDIEDVLERIGVEVEMSETGVERFGGLFHLVTHLSARINRPEIAPENIPENTTVDLVRALHPTPALGVAPRDPSFLALLRELDELCSPEIMREGFGAPFVVKYGDRVEAVVAIRQLRWSFEGDRILLKQGSGCGIVPDSQADREWQELSYKRRAVQKMFRISTEKSEPTFWSLSVLETVLNLGVRHFIVCAGARNAPLVVALEALREEAKTDFLRIESFFDERSAAFYALGLARGNKSPVAVVTTSGTAVTELHSALAEADLSGVPLVAITADRPRRLRNSGAPQSIPQNGIFKNFVEREWDLEEGDEFRIDLFSGIRPLHINVCLEEPLLADAESDPTRLKEAARVILNRLETRVSPTGFKFEGAAVVSARSKIEEWLALRAQNGMVAIVGSLPLEDRNSVREFLRRFEIPCLLEGPSGLRGDLKLQKFELRGGDRDLSNWCASGECRLVLRLGGIPTSRVWRDLDDPATKTQTLSLSNLRFSGLSRGDFVFLPGPGRLSEVLNGLARESTLTPLEMRWLEQDRASAERLDKAISETVESEPSFVYELSKIIPPDAVVYVGNSLPIRWWDLAATRDSQRPIEANRGVNGIDGQISTALGLAASLKKELWVLVGDLTALYDLAAPWALRSKEFGNHKIRIVVLNNSGGRIFTRVLAKAPGGSAPFENQHDLRFEQWSAMWNLDYARIVTPTEMKSKLEKFGQHAVLELVPSSDATAEFWKKI